MFPTQISNIVSKFTTELRTFKSGAHSNTVITRIMKLGSGRIIAQILAFSLTPILSRIYAPSDYGLLGVFMSVEAIALVFTTLTYEKAVVLPKERIKAIALTKLISIWSGSIILFLLIICLFAGKQLVLILKQPPELESVLFLLPIYILIVTQKSLGKSWSIREGKFGLIAKLVVIIVLVTSAVKLVLGLNGFTGRGLVIGVVIGEFSGFLLLFFGCKPFRDFFFRRPKCSAIQVAKEYSEFPKYGLPQTSLNVLSRRSSSLFLGAFFSPAIVGYFWFGYRMVMLPMELLNDSVRSVFLKEIADRVNSKRPLYGFIKKSTICIFLAGIVPIVLLIIFSPTIFRVFFGETWVKAGEYTRWLSIWILVMFLNLPAVQTLTVLKKQKIYLRITLYTAIGRIAGLVTGGLLGSDILAVFLFSIAGTINNLTIIFIAFKEARAFDKAINTRTGKPELSLSI